MGLGKWTKKKPFPNGLQVSWCCEGRGSCVVTIHKKGSKALCTLAEIFPAGHRYCQNDDKFVGERSEVLHFIKSVQEL